MELYGTVRWGTRTIGTGTKLAYYGMKELYYDQQDRRNPRYHLSRRDPATGRRIPADTYQYGSAEYNALTLAQRTRVDRYLPGSAEYEALHPAERAIVDARNRTRHKVNILTEPMRKYIRNVPVPYLQAFIRNRVQAHYYCPFDPNRRNHIEMMTGPDVIREATWTRDKTIEGFRDQLNMIRTTPDYPRLREWYNSSPDAVRQALFNVEANFTKLSLQMRINITKMDALTKLCIKCLRKYIIHMSIIGKKGSSSYWDSFNAYFGKMLSASGGFNEPTIGGRGPMMSPLWG